MYTYPLSNHYLKVTISTFYHSKFKIFPSPIWYKFLQFYIFTFKLILRKRKFYKKKTEREREMERDGIGHNSVVRQGESWRDENEHARIRANSTQVQRTLFNYTAPHWLRHAETIHSVSRGSFRRHVLYWLAWSSLLIRGHVPSCATLFSIATK